MTLPVCNEWHLDSSGELATPPACPGSDRELDTYEAVFLGRAKTAVPSLSEMCVQIQAPLTSSAQSATPLTLRAGKPHGQEELSFG